MVYCSLRTRWSLSGEAAVLSRLSLAALPFIYQFAAGAIAGVTELLCLYPLGELPSRRMIMVERSS